MERLGDLPENKKVGRKLEVLDIRAIKECPR